MICFDTQNNRILEEVREGVNEKIKKNKGSLTLVIPTVDSPWARLAKQLNFCKL